MLSGIGIIKGSYIYNPPLWYITYLILFLPLLIILLSKYKEIYKYFLVWFLPIMLYSLDMDYVNKIAIWEGGIFQVFRGVSGLLVGSLLFFLTDYYKKNNHIPKRLFRLLSIIGFGYFVWITIFLKDGGIEISAGIIGYLFVIMFFMLMCDENYIENKYIYSICIHLGKLALPIYCIHFPIQEWIQTLYPEKNYLWKLKVAIFVTIILAELLIIIGKSSKKLKSNRKFLWSDSVKCKKSF